LIAGTPLYLVDPKMIEIPPLLVQNYRIWKSRFRLN
jgi:hypothetical protein